MAKKRFDVITELYAEAVKEVTATPENWMGIQEFSQKIEYIFFCMILMFLEEKEAEEQFVLSELTEYVRSEERRVGKECAI